MSGSRTHRVTVELRSVSDQGTSDTHPVEGRLELADGSVRAFFGWLGLVNELERLILTETSAG
jgi:hypothetical protein